jgi:hypothetical protein
MATNSTVNYTNPNIDQTVRVFDSFYRYEANVPAEQYDIVNSYFKSVMTTRQAADNFTNSLFRVADQTNIPIMDLLQSIQGQSGMQLNVSMAYYLNNIRSNATLVGIGTPASPNFYIARCVVQ